MIQSEWQERATEMKVSGCGDHISSLAGAVPVTTDIMKHWQQMLQHHTLRIP